MRDYRNILSGDVLEELLDRFDELAGTDPPRPPAPGRGALESLREGELESADAGSTARASATKDEAASILRRLQADPQASDVLPRGLEAIILQFGRPAYLVQGGKYSTDGTPSSSRSINALVSNEANQQNIVRAIPSVGRIDLAHHDLSWVGTGWVIADDIVVTNRHVAREFAEADGSTFAFVQDYGGRDVEARLDTLHEHGSQARKPFRMREVLWIEPNRNGHHDIAFLAVDAKSEDGKAQQPPRIELMADDELERLGAKRWIAVIGYPAASNVNDAEDQQRIFQGIFDVKRMQPGQVLTLDQHLLLHDASTLGGNSGSVVLDIETGKVVGLHFGGYEGETNFAVRADVVRKVLRERTGREI